MSQDGAPFTRSVTFQFGDRGLVPSLSAREIQAIEVAVRATAGPTDHFATISELPSPLKSIAFKHLRSAGRGSPPVIESCSRYARVIVEVPSLDGIVWERS